MSPRATVRRLALPLLGLLLVVTLVAASCKRSEPVKLGFIGGLSGRLSSLGIAGRNGVIFAVEEINAAGGLNGQPVTLEIIDDRQEAETVRNGMRELNRRGVSAVIGPLTSAMAVEAVPISNELQLVTMGPTISTNDLSGKDDYFFRPRPASKVLAQRIAYHMRVDRGLKRLCVVFDTNNRAHTASWFSHLKAFFEGYGGSVVHAVPFSSAQNLSYTALAREMRTRSADSYFLLASSIDTGLIAQQLRKQGVEKPLFASEWSFTNDLLQFGGKAVEGLTICHTYNLLDSSTRFEDFRRRFTNRFGVSPSFAAGHSYDATRFILAALQVNPDPARLKETLLGMNDFSGLQSTITLDRYGDTERKTFLTTIENGSFTLLE